MSIQKFEALIFDLDGTLYDKKNIVLNTMASHWREIPILHASNKLRKTLKGIDLGNSEDFHNTFYGKIAEASGKKFSKVEHWYQRKFYPRFIRALKKKYKARKKLIPLLEQMKGLVPMAVFSDYSYVKERLNALHIPTDVFTVMAGSEEYGVLKPSPRPLLDIARKLGVPADNVLVVGDRVDTDGEAARMAGMMFYHITDGDEWEKFVSDVKDFLKKGGRNG